MHDLITREEATPRTREQNVGESSWGIPGAQRGIESLIGGVRNWWQGRKQPEPTGIARYQDKPEFRTMTDRLFPGADKLMTEKVARPFGEWVGGTVVPSAKEWWKSYERGSPVTKEVSRDWRGQIGDVGKWFVNTPYTIGTAIADVGADVGQFFEAVGPEWMGEGGRDIFSKEQKYQWDAAAVDKFGIKSFYKDNPYVKYDWNENWTAKTNPILEEMSESVGKFMYNEFLDDEMEQDIWSEIGNDRLEGKTRKEQGDLFHDHFINKYINEWNMHTEAGTDRILKRDYGLGTKGEAGAIEEFEIGLNYDPLLPYSTSEDAFLRGATKGVGEALLWVGGPGMLMKSRKFVPKWKKKHLGEGIMGAARGTKYGDPEPWEAPEYLRIGSR